MNGGTHQLSGFRSSRPTVCDNVHAPGRIDGRSTGDKEWTALVPNRIAEWFHLPSTVAIYTWPSAGRLAGINITGCDDLRLSDQFFMNVGKGICAVSQEA
jgi:hypothetical protein